MSQFQQTFQAEGQNDIRMDREVLIYRTILAMGSGPIRKVAWQNKIP